jgi:uncharacterized hydantoinase/oxoprolinase family protein
MMETPEGFVPQEQHDQAMLSLRAELSDAINEKQAEIDDLKTQVANAVSAAMAQVRQDFSALQSDRDRWVNEAEQYKRDNIALRKNLSDYLMSTDGGKAAIRDFNVMVLRAQADAIQKRLAELEAL